MNVNWHPASISGLRKAAKLLMRGVVFAFLAHEFIAVVLMLTTSGELGVKRITFPKSLKVALDGSNLYVASQLRVTAYKVNKATFEPQRASARVVFDIREHRKIRDYAPRIANLTVSDGSLIIFVSDPGLRLNPYSPLFLEVFLLARCGAFVENRAYVVAPNGMVKELDLSTLGTLGPGIYRVNETVVSVSVSQETLSSILSLMDRHFKSSTGTWHLEAGVPAHDNFTFEDQAVRSPGVLLEANDRSVVHAFLVAPDRGYELIITDILLSPSSVRKVPVTFRPSDALLIGSDVLAIGVEYDSEDDVLVGVIQAFNPKGQKIWSFASPLEDYY